MERVKRGERDGRWKDVMGAACVTAQPVSHVRSYELALTDPDLHERHHARFHAHAPNWRWRWRGYDPATVSIVRARARGVRSHLKRHGAALKRSQQEWHERLDALQRSQGGEVKMQKEQEEQKVRPCVPVLTNEPYSHHQHPSQDEPEIERAALSLLPAHWQAACPVSVHWHKLAVPPE